MERLARIILRQRLLVWTIRISLTALSVAGLHGLRLVPRGERQAWPQDDEWDAFNQTRDRFRAVNIGTFLVLECEDFFTIERLGALRQLVKACEQHRLVGSVIWFNSLPAFEDGTWQRSIPARLSEEDLARVQQRLTRHPLAAGQLISPSQRVIMFPIVLRGYDKNTFVELAETAQTVAERHGMTARLTGSQPLDFSQSSSIKEW